MKPIITERLVLSAWKVSDAADLYSYAKNPNVGPSAGWAPHSSIMESLQLIITFLKPNGVYAIRPKSTGRAIGTIGLYEDKYRPGIHSMELGYSMSEDYWGRGIMTEAAQAVMKYGFETLRLDRICVTVSPGNEKSERIIEKCGFTYEGTLREAFMIYDGTLRDLKCFSISRKEYFNR